MSSRKKSPLGAFFTTPLHKMLGWSVAIKRLRAIWQSHRAALGSARGQPTLECLYVALGSVS